MIPLVFQSRRSSPSLPSVERISAGMRSPPQGWMRPRGRSFTIYHDRLKRRNNDLSQHLQVSYWVHSFETSQALKLPTLQRNVSYHIKGNSICCKIMDLQFAFLSRTLFRHLFASSKLLQSQSLYMISTPSRLRRFTQFGLQLFS